MRAMLSNEASDGGGEESNLMKANGDTTNVDENIKYLNELMKDLRTLNALMGTGLLPTALSFGSVFGNIPPGPVFFDSLSFSNAQPPTGNYPQLRHAHLLVSAEIDRVWSQIYPDSQPEAATENGSDNPNVNLPSPIREALHQPNAALLLHGSTPDTCGVSFLDRRSPLFKSPPPPLVFDPSTPSPQNSRLCPTHIPIFSPPPQQFIPLSSRHFAPHCNNWHNDDYYFRGDPHHFSNEPHVVFTIQDKIYLPDQNAHRNGGRRTNYIGRILGPCGITVKQLEAETDCLILIRGKGSVKDPQRENRLRGIPGWEHLNERLHVIIRATDYTKERCEQKLHVASEKIRSLLTPEHDEHKKRQLIQLAIINGTYRQEHYGPDKEKKSEPEKGGGGNNSSNSSKKKEDEENAGVAEAEEGIKDDLKKKKELMKEEQQNQKENEKEEGVLSTATAKYE